MSYLAIYFLGFLIMVVLNLIAILSTGKLRLSDIIIIFVSSLLSFGGVAVLIVVLFCNAIGRWLDKSGKNKVLWCKE